MRKRTTTRSANNMGNKKKPRKVEGEQQTGSPGIGAYFSKPGETSAENTPVKKIIRTNITESAESAESTNVSPLSSNAEQRRSEGTPESGNENIESNIHGLTEKHLSLLPTKQDMEAMFKRIEDLHERDMKELQMSFQGFHERLETLEGVATPLITSHAKLCEMVQDCYIRIQSLQTHVEELEDRSRRNNIRIRGIPEKITTTDLKGTVQAILSTLLGSTTTDIIEIDRLHRVPGFYNPKYIQPRDVLCRIHFFKQKEEIILKAREKGSLEFNEAKLTFFPDISKKTLAKRRALRPLTQALTAAGIAYSWGYPFQLKIKKDGQLHMLRSPKDLQAFLEVTGVPAVVIDDWPDPPIPEIPQLPNWESWTQVQTRKQKGYGRGQGQTVVK